jgi:hypothetical protein
VQKVADIIIEMGTPGRGAPPSLRWLADWLPDADLRTLDEQEFPRCMLLVNIPRLEG